MIVVYTVAFTYILRIRSEGFVFSLMLGLLSWTFFASSAAMSTGAIVDNAGLLKSVSVPAGDSPDRDGAVQPRPVPADRLGVPAGHDDLVRVPPSAPMMLFPVFLALQVVLTIGVALILATATAFFRDVRHLLEVALAVMFWTTPIVYELRDVPERMQLLILMSPVSPFVVAYQQIFFYGDVAGRDRVAGGDRPCFRGVHGRRPALSGVRRPVHGAVVVAVIDAQSVSKRFLLRHNASAELKVRFLGFLHPDQRESIEEFWALKDVSLRIEHGEALGLVGRNGSGKSTLLKLIAGIHRPTSGRLLVARHARISSMIELGVGFHPGADRPRERVPQRLDSRPEQRSKSSESTTRSSSTRGSNTSSTSRSRTTRRACTCGWGSRSRRTSSPTSCCSTRSSRSATPIFSSAASPRCSGSWPRARRLFSCRMRRRRSAPSAAVSACSTRVELAFDGDVDGGLDFYERLLAHPPAVADGA